MWCRGTQGADLPGKMGPGGFRRWAAGDGKATVEEDPAQLHLIMDTIPDLLWMARPDGQVDYCNQSLLRFTGLTLDQCQCQGWLQTLHPEDTVYASQAWEQARRSGQAFEIELRVRRWDGEYRYILVRATPLLDPTGQVLQWYGANVDITERKQAELALQKSEERFRTLFETMAQGVIYHQPDGRIISANPAAQRIVGLSLEQMLGHSPTSANMRTLREDGTELPGEEYPAIQALRTGRPVNNVVVGGFQPATGRYVWINVNAIPLFKAGETKPYQVYTTLDDISERKRYEGVLLARLRLIDFARTHGANELLQATLDEAGKLVSSPLGLYYFVTEAQDEISLQAWSTHTRGELLVTDEGHRSRLSEAGAWADAARQYCPVIYNRPTILVDRRGLPPEYDGLVRELVVPVIRGGQVVAMMWVGNKTSDYDFTDLETVVALADFSWDIVQHSRAHQDLQASEEQYRRLLNLLPSGVLVHSQGCIELVNQAGVRLFGASGPEQLIGSPTIERAAPESLDEINAQVCQAMQQGQADALVEGKLRRLDGSIFDAELAVIRVMYSGKPAILTMFNDITERKYASDQLKQTLAEKEALLRELYHRTKNNMSVINSLLDLQSMFVQDERLKSAFAASRGRIRAMSLVHEKLYSSSDLSRLNLKEYVQDLVDLLRQIYVRVPGRLSMQTELEDVYVLIDTAIPCGLVLNELLTNALKHAFPGGRSGVIRVTLQRMDSGEIYLAVSDDGVGMPPGFAPRQDGQMGMQMIFALAESQLRARVSFCTTPGVACQLVFEDNLYFARV